MISKEQSTIEVVKFLEDKYKAELGVIENALLKNAKAGIVGLKNQVSDGTIGFHLTEAKKNPDFRKDIATVLSHYGWKVVDGFVY